jgi:rsbT antagonist protein RsbS
VISEAPRIPILQIEDYLVASIQTELHDQIAVQFKDDLLQRIYTTKTRGVVIDLTAMEVVDSFIARIIGELAEMARLMGTKVVVTGLQPAVAITLVELGVEMHGIVTALNLEKGIATLRHMVHNELLAPAPGRDRDTDSFGKPGAVWPHSGSGKTN